VSVKDLTYTVKAEPPKIPTEGLQEKLVSCLPWCCNSKKRKVKKDILKNITFQLKPGQMTLLLGTPGSPHPHHRLGPQKS